MGSIRFILAISVVIAHSSDFFGFGLVGGEMAVKLFFMISGFYMALILNEKYINSNDRYWLFLKNRILRLYPLYFLVLFASILVMYFGYQQNPDLDSAYTAFLKYKDQLSPGSWAYLAGVNGLMFGMDSSLFLGLNPETGTLFFTENFASTNPKVYSFLYVPQSWSISIEFMFYLVTPLIVRNLKLLIGLLIGSFLIALYLFIFDFPTDPWNYRFFPSQFMFFALGSSGFLIYKKIKSRGVNVSVFYKWALFMIAVVTTLSYSFLLEVFNAFYLSIFTVVIYAIAIPAIFDLSKSWKKDRFIGELSYSIYMWHLLIIYCIHLVGITRIFIFGVSEMAVGLTIVLSILTQIFFLQRIERFRIIK